MKHPSLLFISLCLLAGCSSVPPCETPRDIQPVVSQLNLSMLDNVPIANQQREERALRLFEAVGCDHLERQFVSERFGYNLICEINGRLESHILVGAHHDKYGVSNGIADNWTGVVSVVSLAHFFSLNSPKHTMRFVLFAGEEKNLQGARFCVEQAVPPAKMINLDTLGTAPLKVDSKSARDLQCIARGAAASQGMTLQEAYLRDITGDWQPFRRKDIPVLAFHALNEALLVSLHGPADNRELVDDDLLQEAYVTILNTVIEIDRL